MKTRQNFRRLFGLSGILLFALIAFGGAIPAVYGQTDTIVIEFRVDGFNPQTVTVPKSSTVTWRNLTSAPFTLRGGERQQTIYLPLIMKSAATPQAGQAATSQVEAIQNGPPADPFEATVPPGGKFSHQFNTPGHFNFVNVDAPTFSGQVV